MGGWPDGWLYVGEATTDGKLTVLVRVITRGKPLALPFLTPQNDEVPNA